MEKTEWNAVPETIAQGRETMWINPYLLPAEMTRGVCELCVGDEDIDDAQARFARFAPFIARQFPETRAENGLIESPTREIERTRQALERTLDCEIPGRLLLKMDSHLAIAGSVKARGGIYEVLHHAEQLALSHGMIDADADYSRFAEPEMKAFFSRYTVQVGSTGNLGMSIGIMSAALGFRAIVHMSSDARQWKKDLLRSHGVTVIEYAADYSKAVAQGRAASDADPMSYFVDDEKSVNLFLGYAVAARRIRGQLAQMGAEVNAEHPLLVYIPAGVGGAPGGIAYGLKRLFGDDVHCFFCEPTQCPSVLLGVATQRFERVNVRDYGLTGRTEADGLACASPSGFVTRIMTNLLSGGVTVEDGRLYDFLRTLYGEDGVFIEPSSCAAFMGPVRLLTSDGGRAYCRAHDLTPERLSRATQVVWATGGRMVPQAIREEYLQRHLPSKSEGC